MSNEMTTATKKTVPELDGFNAFTNEVEGDDDVNTGSSIIQGTKLKYLGRESGGSESRRLRARCSPPSTC